MSGTGATTQRLWTHRETAAYLSISITQLHNMNSAGTGPRSYKVGGLRRYNPDDVHAWLEQRASDHPDRDAVPAKTA